MRLLIFPICFAMLSCQQNKVPEGIMAPEKMEKVIQDLVYADEVANYRKIRDSSYNDYKKTLAIYDSVLSIHQINKAQLQSSLQYYQTRPDILKIILDSLQKDVEVSVNSSQVQ